jgi:hypothetical protein
MATTSGNASPFVISDGRVDPAAGNVSRLAQAAAPVVIGLMAPILLMQLLDPAILKHARFLVVAVLIPLLLVSVAIYVYSVLNPGDVCGLVVDPKARRVEVVQANMFASRRTGIAFSDIAKVHVVAGYDRDGYAESRAELVLLTGERVPLPAGTADAQVLAMRRAIGLR